MKVKWKWLEIEIEKCKWNKNDSRSRSRSEISKKFSRIETLAGHWKLEGLGRGRLPLVCLCKYIQYWALCQHCCVTLLWPRHEKVSLWKKVFSTRVDFFNQIINGELASPNTFMLFRWQFLMQQTIRGSDEKWSGRRWKRRALGNKLERQTKSYMLY